ncbi:unnamed protein product [Litomosoides sigmodontis]|uniref:Uncharacterized protein n=1 Tax=Litomosoides sigmodontis TaxID=42156 RepID=A0A3P6S494_LITSI|nr:unnamed protein product [Litomosoides sigmodontis]
MDDFIFPEDIAEENTGVADMDFDGSGVTDSGGGNRELEPKLDSVLSVDQCAEAMTDTLQKYEEIKKRIAEVDQLAMQAGLERQKLSSGSSLLMIHLRNNSSFEMIKWHLALITSSYHTSATAEGREKIFTKVIPIERLSQHSEIRHEVLCTCNLPTSLFFRVHLLKCIHLSRGREPGAFRIALEPIYLTHWDAVTVTVTPENTISRLIYYPRIDEVQKITLPDALVYLICERKQTETMLLSWIIMNTLTDGCDCVNCMVLDDENVRWPFTLEVKKQELNYNVVLKMKNAKMRCILIDELKIRILIRMQYIWKELKEKEDCELLLDNKSLSDCFASLIAKYKR